MAWLSQCLSQFKVRDLSLAKELVALQHPKQTLFDAIQVLSEHHLLSAPVLDADGKLLGMLDTLDIVKYVVDSAGQGKQELSDQALDVVVGKALYRGTKVAKVSLDDSVDDVGDIVAGQARRAVVLGADGSPCSVVTQSTLVQFLVSKKDDIEGLRRSGLAKDHCSIGAISVTEQETALKAFETLSRMEVSSLVTVDEAGAVLTMVSATDLVVGLSHMQDKTAAIAALQSATVVDFVLAHRRPDLRDRAATVAVPPSMPLQDVMEKLAQTRVHRVVVMCENRKPVGVLSLSDICRAVANPGRLG